MGRNGAGKSTTLKSIMGLVPKCTGAVHFMGQSITRQKTYRIARSGLGYVPEDRRIFTDLSVGQNLDVGRQPMRHWPDGRPASNWTMEALYELFPILDTLRNRQAGSLSGGEQQMLTVARTLMGNPYLVLLDEPSEGVAPVLVEQMVAMILALKKQGTSVLLSEQNMHFAQLVSDRASVLEKGLVRYAGTMRELKSNDDILRTYLAL
jgi:branched-chain amino acid transport system ATP-binding protein